MEEPQGAAAKPSKRSSMASWLLRSASASEDDDSMTAAAPPATGDTSSGAIAEESEVAADADTSFMSASSSLSSLYENDVQLLPLAPTPVHLSAYLNPSSAVSEQDKRRVFTNSFLEAASSGSAEVLEWLLSTPSTSTSAAAARRLSTTPAGSAANEHYQEQNLPDSAPRKWLDLDARDTDGNTALGLAVALGHAEAVRALIEGGVNIAARDNAGWTALHWAVQNNDLPIAAYLLNHRAPPDIASRKGLIPRDLVVRGSDGIPMRDILFSAEDAWVEQQARSSGYHVGDAPENGIVSARKGKKPSTNEKAEDAARAKALRKRMELAMESAQALEVDLSMLGVDGTTDKLLEDSNAEDDLDVEEHTPFDWTKCQPEHMLVCSLEDLPALFEMVITRAKPNRVRKYRVVPANVIFLCARFAHYYGTEELLKEVCLGAIERMETAVHNRSDDMANCAFWLSNALLLLYYLKKEVQLNEATAEEQGWLTDLINEVFVIIIRDAERRIDKILDAAMLDYEAVEGFEDVAFGDEWASTRFVKKLTGRSKKSPVKGGNIRNVFAATESAPSSPSRLPQSPLRAGDKQLPKVEVEESPQGITSILSSTLFILQTYEIPPSIIVQAFSQLFYWIACEVFNRLLGNKKLLSRSKALQIRMNASVLEEWARLNRMPPNLVAVHFTPLNQLLQWLQCLSSESSLDGLVGTVQTLSALNPLQLRRAARDYRHEVDESKMSAVCEQYLVQMQRQWEKLEADRTSDEQQAALIKKTERSASPTPSDVSVQSDVARIIDDAFASPPSFGKYVPPGGEETRSEMLNSRAMLPFALPSSPDMLVNLNQRDAFGPFADEEILFTRSRQSSASTVLSNASASSQTKALQEIVPVLPDDFFQVFDRVKATMAAASSKQKKSSKVVNGLGPAIELSSDGDTSREDGLHDPEETPRLPAGAFGSAVK